MKTSAAFIAKELFDKLEIENQFLTSRKSDLVKDKINILPFFIYVFNLLDKIENDNSSTTNAEMEIKTKVTSVIMELITE
jgi:hypothetical protein